jgi:kinesin family protein 11
MYGADGGKNPAKLDGAVPAICAELFRRKTDLEKRRHNVKMTMDATLVEIRGDQIVDLLADPVTEGDHRGEQPRPKLVRSELQGAHHEGISSQRALTSLIERGMARRLTGANVTHAHSSRSHAFLTIYILKETKPDDDRPPVREVTHMHLVDLAGSEKFSSNDSEGLAINQSLLGLGKVIMAKAKGDPHVPYRDTLLTRMLRDTLESDCTTLVLACLNPGKEMILETKQVLKFMERAAAVRPDRHATEKVLSRLRETLHALPCVRLRRRLIRRVRRRAAPPSCTRSVSSPLRQRLREERIH